FIDIVISAIRVSEIGMDHELKSIWLLLRHVGMNRAIGETLIVGGEDLAVAQTLRANLMPIAIDRVAFPKNMDVLGWSGRERLSIEDLVLAGEAQHNTSDASRVRV